VTYQLRKGRSLVAPHKHFRYTLNLSNHRTELVNIVHSTNGAGIHHGDLKPDNVCIDGNGKVRLIDWHLAEPCCCREECRELLDLMDDISSDLPW
jgi:RIO-like serine/threonine protein kinase